jgi:drug/metabolite transporter (DMT)-like permease
MLYLYNPDLNGFDFSLFNAITSSGLAALQIRSFGISIFDVRKDCRSLMALRLIIGSLGIPCFFMSLKYIPGSKASLIANIHPMLVSVLAYFVLKENLSKIKVTAVIGAFIGTI